MNQANLTHLVSKLPIRVAPKHRKFKNVEGLYGRLKAMRKTVTALVRHERIELNFQRCDEARGYVERLISDAVRYGECHRPTMEQAKFWLDDPVLVPKLFKVLVPRYQTWTTGLPYTRVLRAPSNPTDLKEYENKERAVMELRGHPYPPLPGPMAKKHPGLIHNVLLEEARKDYFKSMSPLAQQVETLVQSLPNDDDTKHLDFVAVDDVDEAVNKEILTSQKDESSSPNPSLTSSPQ